MNVLYFSLFAIFVVLQGCSTTKIAINSEPSSGEVWVKSMESGNYVSIGKTPIVTNSKSLKSKLQSDGPYVVELRKKDYISKSILVTDLSGSQDVSIQLKLQTIVDLLPAQNLNAMVEQLFSSQRLAQSGRYNEALNTISNLQIKYPSLAVTYELQGGIYYLMGELQKSFDSYSLAAIYDPRNLETTMMMQKVRKEMQRMPSSGGGK